MKIDVKKKDDLYQESLIWMGYRYAIGLIEGRGEKAVEQLKAFQGIGFDTPEFYALAAEFAKFLERKKIKDVMDLREKMVEPDLIWYSAHYALGRHSYAASHCYDIVRYGLEVMSPEQQEFTAFDIRRELSDRLRWSTPFRMPLESEQVLDPIDVFLSYLKEHDIKTSEQLAEYKIIEVVIARDGTWSYHTEMRGDGEKETYLSPFSFGFSDYFGWADLASFFDPKFHKRALLRNGDQEEIVDYFDSWTTAYHSPDGFPFKKVKRPIEEYKKNPSHGVYLVDEYVVEEL